MVEQNQNNLQIKDSQQLTFLKIALSGKDMQVEDDRL